MTREEFDSLHNFLKDTTAATGILFRAETFGSWAITTAYHGKVTNCLGCVEVHCGRKLSAHKLAVEAYIRASQNPEIAKRRESRYHRDTPDFPTFAIKV